ncbi:hypothetical protein CEXT_155941 [Caerostris extrusa]|uniref:Uncharacterized protein n=1 Tax=Caerostris extrusa TaxID=172846 RepID=A0AAV4QDG4_CAEEX|nr:hypothetical protein CEXT_155941 [Caerostris extrusa]
MAHTMGGDDFEDFAEADNAKLMTDNELEENDLVDMVNETNNRDGSLMKRSLNQLSSQQKLLVKDLDYGENWNVATASVEQERTKVSGGLLKSNSRHSVGKCRSSSAAFVLLTGGKMNAVIKSRHRTDPANVWK